MSLGNAREHYLTSVTEPATASMQNQVIVQNYGAQLDEQCSMVLITMLLPELILVNK